MFTYCGLDFGTSNSAIGSVVNSKPTLLPVESSHPTIPTTMFFHFESDEVFFGREAISLYLDGEFGRLMKSIKNVLGTNTMGDSTQVKYERLTYMDIISRFLSYLRERASESLGGDIQAVTLGRPVHFCDRDKELDIEAQSILGGAARAAGFTEVAFQFEPIAAALCYEQGLEKEEIILVYDIGGGTSDFTVVRLSPEARKTYERGKDILSTGGVHIGGTDFDRKLSMATVMPLLGSRSRFKHKSIEMPTSYFHDLATWHKIHELYGPKVIAHLELLKPQIVQSDLVARLIRVLKNRDGHRLGFVVEDAKKSLSSVTKKLVELEFVEEGLISPFERGAFESTIADDINRISACALDTVKQAGLSSDKIERVFVTGGSSEVPALQVSIAQSFRNATVSLGDRLGSVTMGLTLDAQRRFS